MERLLATHIINYLNDNDNLSVHHFGFHATLSTVGQILATFNDITMTIDEEKVVDLVFFFLTSVNPLIWSALGYLYGNCMASEFVVVL